MSLKATLFWLLIAGAILSTPGCGIFKENVNKREITETFTPEKKKVDIDKRLLKKCPAFTKELVTGSDSEVVMWAQEALKSASDCRKAQHKLADEVIKIFEIK